MVITMAEDAELNWQTSIVDLLKLLGLESGPGARERLAGRLHVNAGPSRSAKQNDALRKAVMKEFASGEEKWIEVMESRRNSDRCFNCGSEVHWELECPGKCGKCTTIMSIYDISALLIIIIQLGLYFGHKASICRHLVRCIECESSL
jgi:Domain of unknown function (DUF3597)